MAPEKKLSAIGLSNSNSSIGVFLSYTLSLTFQLWLFLKYSVKVASVSTQFEAFKLL